MQMKHLFFLASFLTKALFDVNGRLERTRTSTNASPVSQWVPSVKQWWWITAQNCCSDSKTRKSSRWWNLSSFFLPFHIKEAPIGTGQHFSLTCFALRLDSRGRGGFLFAAGFALGLKFAPSREREAAAQRVSEIQPPTSAHQVSASPFFARGAGFGDFFFIFFFSLKYTHSPLPRA